MKTGLIVAATMMLCVVVQGTVGAEDRRNTPDTVGGQVTEIDPARNRVTMRDGDGTVREFEASKETLEDLKVGDRIEAKRRQDSK
jgi:NADPH-dependent 2,4-dienoyl-CoA reductase/sulfur reductase-like enzyme